MKNTILFVLASIFISCSTPLEKLKEMPPKQQRSALAEIGREALVNALREVEGQTPISFLKINQASVRPIEQVVQRATLFRSVIPYCTHDQIKKQQPQRATWSILDIRPGRLERSLRRNIRLEPSLQLHDL